MIEPAARGRRRAARSSGTRAAGAATHSLADQAYAVLKHRIIRCELEPGLRVTEAELVRELGIGKTPVREALTRLIQEGLARNIPRHGYEITPVTLGDVQELFGARLVVEPAIVQLAAGHVDSARLRRLDELCQAAYVPGDLESVSRFLQINHEFHMTVAHAAGNRRLADILERILDESERLFQLGAMLQNRGDKMVHEHRELVELLAVGDADGARRVTIEAILGVQRMVVDALIASPSVRAAQVALPGPDRASA